MSRPRTGKEILGLMMGDSDGPFTDQRRPPAPACQIGAVWTSSINNSQVTIVNVNVNQHFYCKSRPEQDQPCSVHRPEDTVQQPEDTVQGPEDTGHRPEEIGRADDDERKELINSLSGSRDAHLDGNPQEGDGGLAMEAEAGMISGCPTTTHLTHNMHETSSVPSSTEIGRHSAEVDEDIAVKEPSEAPQLQLDSPPFVPNVPVVGSPMPPERSCKITPHPCSVYSSRVCRCLRPFGKVGHVFREETKSSRRVCLVRNALCISSTTRNVVEYVVDLAEKALCLEGCDLTVGRWVITLPENKLSEWKSVSVGIKSRTAPGCAQWSSSPDVRAEAKRKSRSLPQASSVADLLEDNEVTEPEECQGTDEPVFVFKSPVSMRSSTTDLH